MSFFKKEKIDTKIALTVYKKANQIALNNASVAIGVSEVALELEKLFSQILRKENLLDEKEYSRIDALINRWDPVNVSNKEEGACASIQQVLIGILPRCKQQQEQQLKKTVSEFKEHLSNKIKNEGYFLIGSNGELSVLSSDEITPKQDKTRKRYEAILSLDERIRNKPILDDIDILSAKDSLNTCITNRPDWSERPFLQRLTDVLSFGFKPLFRFFTSKETELEEKLDQQLKPR